MRKFTLALLIILSITSIAAAQDAVDGDSNGIFAEITTSKGDFTVQLDYQGTPLAAMNFIGQAEGTITFGSESSQALINGTSIDAKITNYALLLSSSTDADTAQIMLPREPAAAFSSSEPYTLLSSGIFDQIYNNRFIILLGPDPYLDSKHTPFAKVVSGFSVVEKLTEGDVIESVMIRRRGSEAESFVCNDEQFKILLNEKNNEILARLETENPGVAQIIATLGEDVQRSLTGVYYKIDQEGSGDAIRSGDTVSVHYTGSLMNGTVFDSSRERNMPFELTIGDPNQQVIPAWIETLVSMKVGERRRVIIPPYMAYGEMDLGVIPPNSWLFFDIEILKVK